MASVSTYLNFVRNTEEAFKWIVGLLRKHTIPYQIAGGFAARLYGSTRELADIDIGIPEDFIKAQKAAEAAMATTLRSTSRRSSTLCLCCSSFSWSRLRSRRSASPSICRRHPKRKCRPIRSSRFSSVCRTPAPSTSAHRRPAKSKPTSRRCRTRSGRKLTET